jgi:maleylpyruvate isomerase
VTAIDPDAVDPAAATDPAAAAGALGGRLASSTARLVQTAARLTDTEARQASLLPGWSRGHVLTHLARNADSVVWRLEGAARGELRDQYPGGLEQRACDIDAGAGRPAAELVADVRRSAGAVERALRELSLAAWDAPSRTSRGVVEDSRAVVLSRWREVVVHHGDIGLGPVPFPPALIDVWLPQELQRLAERCEPADLLSWVIGRGDPPALGPW